jgi:hypothetical protein
MNSQPAKLRPEDQRELEACIQEKIDARFKQVDSDLATLAGKIDDVHSLMLKLQGAGSLAKLLFFIIAPAIGALVWLKDHVKL